MTIRTRVQLYRVTRKGINEWRWRLRDARNGRIIGASTEGYRNRNIAITNLERVTGITSVPHIPYGSKQIEWRFFRTFTGEAV